MSRWHFRHNTFHQQVGNFLIGEGGSGAWNLGEGGGEDDVCVGEGDAGVAVNSDGRGACDGGGAWNGGCTSGGSCTSSGAGNVSVVEGDDALTGKGDRAIISGNGNVGGT